MRENELLTQIGMLLDEKFQILRDEMAELKSELRGEMAELKSELRGEMAELKSELRGEMAEQIQALRSEMTDMESRLMNEIVDLKGNVSALKEGLQATKDEVRDIKLTLEHEIRPQIKLLAENYIPAAQRYAAASREMERMKTEIDVLKITVTRHSKQLAELTR